MLYVQCSPLLQSAVGVAFIATCVDRRIEVASKIWNLECGGETSVVQGLFTNVYGEK